MLLFSRQYKILYILDTPILILYRKLYINIVSIIVLNIETRQYNIKINLAILCSPKILNIFIKSLLNWTIIFNTTANYCSESTIKVLLIMKD